MTQWKLDPSHLQHRTTDDRKSYCDSDLVGSKCCRITCGCWLISFPVMLTQRQNILQNSQPASLCIWAKRQRLHPELPNMSNTVSNCSHTQTLEHTHTNRYGYLHAHKHTYKHTIHRSSACYGIHKGFLLVRCRSRQRVEFFPPNALAMQVAPASNADEIWRFLARTQNQNHRAPWPGAIHLSQRQTTELLVASRTVRVGSLWILDASYAWVFLSSWNDGCAGLWIRGAEVQVVWHVVYWCLVSCTHKNKTCQQTNWWRKKERNKTNKTNTKQASKLTVWS